MQKRQQVIETAYRLFKRGGFHATGIDRIIAEAGVAKMTMYRHFPSKDELIVAVLEWREQRFERQLDGLVASAATLDRKIATILDWHERWFDGADFHGCLFQHALAEFESRDHPVHRAAARQKLGLKRRLRGILAASMPGDRGEAAATALFMLIEGATLLAQMGQGREAIRSARASATAVLAAQAGYP
ncbi:TetR/AcrR family transcriptional regulator [Kumtagia ephedrae]|uniref:TetR family transcriptional regulator n=1 Tax=Kumtagia ephedrae TaxID=2116701 RepID=A0A2P7RJW8_9HYPH|nr:TetR/AcrR family transcriptional regulator [Mesorhizobium ephedrae]PSJ50508.1 TetR family transcriptional regulator [Mesorhizobium ephedrae]